MIPGVAAAQPYEFDPVDGFEPARDAAGLPYPPADPLVHEIAASTVGLDGGGSVITGGVQAYQHPEVLLAQHPRLWPIWARWSAGLPRELTREDYRKMSHAEVRGWQVMSASRARADRREVDVLRAGAGGGDGD